MEYQIGLLLISLFIGSLALPYQVSDDVDFFTHVDTSARIVGGTTAPVGSVPYMVALSNGFQLRSFVCGGSIIGTRYVLTAAHCIDAVYSSNSLSNNLRGTVGTNRWDTGGYTYRFSRNVTHPNYLSSIIKNDIGLLVTSTDIVFSNLVSPVPLSYDEIDGGVATRVAGWGRIAAGGSLSVLLLELRPVTLGGQECVEEAARADRELNIRAPPVDPHLELCVYHSVGHGMCNGDSGSALVRTDTLQQIGVVSWGFPCALGAPDMFARVSAFRDWLVANTA